MKKKIFVFLTIWVFCLTCLLPAQINAVGQQASYISVEAKPVLYGTEALIDVSLKSDDGLPITTGEVKISVTDDKGQTLLDKNFVPDKNGAVQVSITPEASVDYEVKVEYLTPDKALYLPSTASTSLKVNKPVKLFEKPSLSKPVYEYGTTLDDIEIEGGKTNVPGQFTFKDTDQTLDLGNNTCEILFVPDDTSYDPIDFGESLSINIVPATPVLDEVKVEETEDGKFQVSGKAVGADKKEVKGTFTLSDQNAKVDTEREVEVLFTPEDTDHYKKVTAKASVIKTDDESKQTQTQTTVAAQKPVKEKTEDNQSVQIIQGDKVVVINPDEEPNNSDSSEQTAVGQGDPVEAQNQIIQKANVLNSNFINQILPTRQLIGIVAVTTTLIGLAIVLFRQKIF